MLSALLLALAAARAPVGPHLRSSPRVGDGKPVISLAGVLPSLAANAVPMAAEGGSAGPRMLCDITAIKLDECFAGGAETCELPADACLSVDEVVALGANASLAHAALLKRHQAFAQSSAEDPNGASTSAFVLGRTDANLSALPSSVSLRNTSASPGSRLASAGGRGAPGGTQLSADNYAASCNAYSSPPVCSVSAWANSCYYAGTTCRVTASARLYPCASPATADVYFDAPGSTFDRWWQFNVYSNGAVRLATLTDCDVVYSLATYYLGSMLGSTVVAAFEYLAGCGTATASIVVFVRMYLSGRAVYLRTDYDIELNIDRFPGLAYGFYGPYGPFYLLEEVQSPELVRLFQTPVLPPSFCASTPPPPSPSPPPPPIVELGFQVTLETTLEAFGAAARLVYRQGIASIASAPLQNVLIDTVAAGSLVVHTRIRQLAATTTSTAAQPSVAEVHERLARATPETISAATGVRVAASVVMLDPPAPPPPSSSPLQNNAEQTKASQGGGGDGRGGGAKGGGSSTASAFDKVATRSGNLAPQYGAGAGGFVVLLVAAACCLRAFRRAKGGAQGAPPIAANDNANSRARALAHVDPRDAPVVLIVRSM
ncbi:hypothetical protein KFE25_012833 [Diacronema lutheri]|uniref:Uncharacterized protein n=1 Tax=Diacronema lutheri TaxID=2081491 RepID=A0A8J5X4Y6_DIALT|nr:hypothetical protein KFE25_012833 [Diacronema lutheri]